MAVVISPNTLSANLKIAGGMHTTISADDLINTGLRHIVNAVACLESDPVLGADRAQAFRGDQAGTPAPGMIRIRTYRPTSAGDTNPIAATAFGLKVSWMAVGV